MDIQLDLSQQAVVDRSIDSRALVIAGPGSGKTLTSVELIRSFDEQLVDSYGSEILYLSFSRAAIGAAFKNFTGIEDHLDISIDIRTLDSLAYAFRDDSENEALEEEPRYDLWRQQAISNLNQFGPEEFEHFVHVIIDEFQDIRGPRLEFLDKVLGSLPEDCGITIFADPYQSIYDFFEDENRPVDHGSSWEESVDVIRSHGVVDSFVLSGQYRAESIPMKELFQDLSEVRSKSVKTEIANVLSTSLGKLQKCEVAQFASMARVWRGNTAVLVRTNCEAIWMTDQLLSEGVPAIAQLRRGYTSYLPPWIGCLASRTSDGRMNANDLISAANELEFEGVSEQIRSLADRLPDNRKVEVTTLARLLKSESDLDVPTQGVPGVVSVMTIHQAKGLEFDNVGVLRASDLIDADSYRGLEAELAFVALSRARKKAINIQSDVVPELNVEGFPVLAKWYRRQRIPKALLIMPSDIEPIAKSRELLNTDGNDIQILEFENMEEGINLPRYRVKMKNETVAITSKEFGNRLAMSIGKNSGPWPTLRSVPFINCQARVDASKEPYGWVIPAPLSFAELGFSKLGE